MEQSQIENIFTYHAPKGDQSDRYVAIREKAKELATLINDSSVPSAEQTLAIRHIQQGVMFANAGIANHE